MTKHTRKRGTGTVRKDGYIAHYRNKRIVFEHIEIAERALGHPLPRGAQIHHVDGDPANNAPGNLVICPSKKYHMELHARDAARTAGYPMEWRKCAFCKNYDNPNDLFFSGVHYHKACRRQYLKARYDRIHGKT
jgi:hypothetical protein